MGFNELGNTFRLWVATTSSSESTEEFRGGFTAGLEGLIAVLKCMVICDDEACTCCQDVLAIREHSNMMQWMDAPGLKNINAPDLPVGYVTNDNICAVRKALRAFKDIKAFNTCAAHAGCGHYSKGDKSMV